MREQDLIPYSCSFKDAKRSNSTVNDGGLDIFRGEYPEHVKRIAMAAPRFVIACEQDKKDIANIYEVNFEFLKVLTNYSYIYEKGKH